MCERGREREDVGVVYLLCHHVSDYVSCVHIDSDESSYDATDQFSKLSSHQLSQLVEILTTNEQKLIISIEHHALVKILNYHNKM